MKGGVQIWPGEEDRIRAIVFDMAALEGTVDGAYWQHVEAGLEDGAYAEAVPRVVGYGTPELVHGYARRVALEAEFWRVVKPLYHGSYMMQPPICEGTAFAGRVASLRLDGRVWLWKKGDAGDLGTPGYATARWDGRGRLEFGDDGPYRGAVSLGDTLEVEAVMPGRCSGWVGSSQEWELNGQIVRAEIGLPCLEGSRLMGNTQKGQKRQCSGGRATAYGVPGGGVLGQVRRWQQGHCRGNYMDYCALPGQLGGESLELEVWVQRFFFRAQVEFPAFTRVFRLKVADVVF